MTKNTDKISEKTQLSNTLSVGNTILNVENISALQRFYQEGVGLELLAKSANEVTLGQGINKIISLSKAPGLHPAPHTTAGLYHNAIVFKSREQLADTLRRMFTNFPDSFIGSADHFVSEAFYFRDPEGNELELYYDRDKSTWKWENGRVKMGLEYIDPIEFIQKYGTNTQEKEHRMGHVHLKVGDIDVARSFYVDTVGFDITAEMPQALFVSVGGYHHHIGMNTWQSVGARPRVNSLGLQSIELDLPSKNNLDDLVTRLENKKIEVVQKKNTISFADPWNNKINVFVHNN